MNHLWLLALFRPVEGAVFWVTDYLQNPLPAPFDFFYSNRLFVKSNRHRRYGLQDWAGANFSGRAVNLDCVAFNCRLNCVRVNSTTGTCPLPCGLVPSAGRRLQDRSACIFPTGAATARMLEEESDPSLEGVGRRLGHEELCNGAQNASGKLLWRRALAHTGGGPAPEVPAPDQCMALESADPCDFTTVIHPNTVAAYAAGSQGVIGYITFSWFARCVITPRSATALGTLNSLNLQGMIMMYPLSIGLSLSYVGSIGDENVIPTLPFVIITGCVEPDKIEESCEPHDQHTLAGIMFISLTNAAPFSIADLDAIAHVTITDDPAPVLEFYLSGGPTFARIFIGVWAVCLCLLSVYTFMTRTHSAWTGIAIFLEGIIGCPMQAVRGFMGWPWWNEGTAVDWGHWMNAAETPYATASTFITAAVWAKAVLGINFTKVQTLIFNLVLASITICVIVFIQIFGLAYAFALWWPAFSTVQREDVTPPILALNVAMQGFYIVCLLIAFYKMFRAAKAGASTVTTTIKAMLPWITVQIIGGVLYAVGQYLELYDVAQRYSRFSPGYNFFVFLTAYGLGQILMSTGQILALHSIARHKSSSSSSSSS